MTTWRTYAIGPDKGGYDRLFYAPSLADAFHQARLIWGSKTLTCYRSWSGR